MAKKGGMTWVYMIAIILIGVYAASVFIDMLGIDLDTLLKVTQIVFFAAVVYATLFRGR